MSSVCFNFHGLSVQVSSENIALLDHVRRDFSAFWVEQPVTSPRFHLQLKVQEPDYGGLPPLRASFVTPRNVCYHSQELQILDYFGRGVLLHRRNEGHIEVWAGEPDLTREIAYLFLLSQAGQHFDRRGLIRIHALGLEYQGQAALLLLPSGGGKSTMALQALRGGPLKVISEDSPLVDASGRVHPFPLCPGIKGGPDPSFPLEAQRTVQRMEFDPKTLIDLDVFGDQWSRQPVPARWLLVGQRSLGEECCLEPLSRLSAVRALLTNMVVGVGLYQGLEFLLERSHLDLFQRLGSLSGRLRPALALLRHCQRRRFVLGRDRQLNQATLLNFLRGNS